MGKNKSFDFDSFVFANAGHAVTGFDYLQIIYKSQALGVDFVLWFSRLFMPDFKNVDGMVFVSELFSAEYYQELLSNGHDSTQVQFWMNLLEITGLFDDLTVDQAMAFAESLADSWNSKLQKEMGRVGRARAICDRETGEVFVTIAASE